MKKRKLGEIGVELIGLDIGYGMTKAVTLGQSLAYPSVWGHSREIKFQKKDIAARYPGDQLTDDEGEWFVGELAKSQLRVSEIRQLRGRTADDDGSGNRARVRLMKVALGKLYPNITTGETISMAIATGLPVDHMRGSNDLKGYLSGQHHIKTDLTDFVANVAQVYVMPQPYGTIYREMLTPRGDLNPCHTYITTGTVDIGTYTTDVALDNNGEYIDSASGSVEIGISSIEDRIANAYERDFKEKPSKRTVETILATGCFKANGVPVDYTHEVYEAVQPLKDGVLNLMNTLWLGAVSIDVIYVSGGGAGFIGDEIAKVYPQAKTVEQPLFANAAGYLNYALFDRLQPKD